MLNKKITTIFFILVISIVLFFFLTLSPGRSIIPPHSPLSPTPTLPLPTLPAPLYLDQFAIKGDGTDEGPAIQAALNNAASQSIKTVIFPAGKVITTGSLRIPKGLTLIGNGCTLRLKENAHTDEDPWTWIYVQENCNVSGFKFDGNRFNGNGKNTDGLMLQGNNIFENNEVFDVNSYSVFVYGHYPSDIRITNNIIRNSRQYGITTGGGDDQSSWGYNITVTGNTISDCAEVAIKVRGTKGAIIADNVISIPEKGVWSRGISLYSWDAPNEDIVIRNNTITGNLDRGSGTSQGICSDDDLNTFITITDNHVSSCDEGIQIAFNNGIITNNTVFNCTDSIVNSGSDNVIKNNILI